MLDMLDGKLRGFFVMGENPAVGSANGKLQRLAMANVDWMVVRDLAMIETAEFWATSPRSKRRAQERGDRHRGVLPAGRRPHSKTNRAEAR